MRTANVRCGEHFLPGRAAYSRGNRLRLNTADLANNPKRARNAACRVSDSAWATYSRMHRRACSMRDSRLYYGRWGCGAGAVIAFASECWLPAVLSATYYCSSHVKSTSENGRLLFKDRRCLWCSTGRVSSAVFQSLKCLKPRGLVLYTHTQYSPRLTFRRQATFSA
jgi:ferredoxin-like protein FixX